MTSSNDGPLVLITAPRLGAPGVHLLQEAGARLVYVTGPQNAAEVERLLAEQPFDAVISRALDLTEKAMRSCPSLKVISKHGVGVSNVDVEAATRLGIPVYITPGANAQSVVELTLGMMVSAARSVGRMDRELRAGRWTRIEDGIQLAGRTLGVVGFGRIGSRVARAAMAGLGMSAVAYDPLYLPDQVGTSQIDGVRLCASLDELLQQSDVVTLHVPLDATTRNMIGRAQIERMPPKGILINTARGRVVVEADLVDALKSGRLYAAALDTLPDEPISPDSELLRLDNVLLTPHIGGSTPDALAAVALIVAENLLNFLNGRRPDVSACMNPQVLAA